jgi:BASS family bile acid:Na+ symporter
MNLIEIIKLALKISLVLTALGYGLKATPTDAFYLFRNPGQLIRSILAMNILMPAVAIGMALVFDLPPLVKVALIAISVSPLAPLFPKKPLQAGGHESYVIGLMVAASLFSIVLIPLTLELIGDLIDKPVEFSTKAIFLTVLVTVIVPLVLGIAFRYFAPTFAEKIASPVARFAQILLILSFLPILFKLFPAIFHLIGNGTVLAIAAFVVIGVLVGHLLGGSDQENRTVLALATAFRHPAIALTLASANLPDHKLVPATIILYLFINAIVVLPYIKWVERGNAKNTG